MDKYIKTINGYHDVKCRATVQSGKNKGKRCNFMYKCKGYLCSRHYKSIYKIIHLN